jgi:hypothetical protein
MCRGAGVVLSVVVVALVSGCSGSHNKHAAAPSPRVSEVPFSLPASDVAALASGFASQNPATEASVLASSVRPAFQAQPTPLLPPGSHVTIDASSAVKAGRLARVHAGVTGPKPGTFDLVLTLENGHWLLLSTVQIS